MASKFSSLGMFGTICGMIYMMAGISDMDLKAVDLTEFALGMSTALYTTGVGIMAKNLLEVQIFNLDGRLE